GQYPIVPVLNDPNGKLGNYTVATNFGILTVTSAPLVVNVDSATRLYGSENPVFTGSVEGIKNGDQIAASYATAAFASSSVGQYPIYPVLNDPDGKLVNYTVVTNLGILTVTSVPLVVNVDSFSRLY